MQCPLRARARRTRLLLRAWPPHRATTAAFGFDCSVGRLEVTHSRGLSEDAIGHLAFDALTKCETLSASLHLPCIDFLVSAESEPHQFR